MSQHEKMPALPRADFTAWMSDGRRDREPDLLRPYPRAVNAFPWGPYKTDEDRDYWFEKGFWQDPLFTAEQMRAYAIAYAEQRVHQEREECAKVCDGEFQSWIDKCSDGAVSVKTCAALIRARGNT